MESEVILAKDLASCLRNLSSEITGNILSSGQFIRLAEAQSPAVVACRRSGIGGTSCTREAQTAGVQPRPNVPRKILE